MNNEESKDRESNSKNFNFTPISNTRNTKHHKNDKSKISTNPQQLDSLRTNSKNSSSTCKIEEENYLKLKENGKELEIDLNLGLNLNKKGKTEEDKASVGSSATLDSTSSSIKYFRCIMKCTLKNQLSFLKKQLNKIEMKIHKNRILVYQEQLRAQLHCCNSCVMGYDSTSNCKVKNEILKSMDVDIALNNQFLNLKRKFYNLNNDVEKMNKNSKKIWYSKPITSQKLTHSTPTPPLTHTKN